MKLWVDWVGTPLIVIVILAIGALFFKFARWTSSVDSDRANLKEFMKEVRGDIKKILQRLPPASISTDSPLRLTDFGKQLAEEADANKIVDRLYESREIEKEVQGKSKYEIQEFCFEYMANKVELLDNEAKIIQRCAFNNGISHKDISRVLGIVLRDKIFSILPD